MSKKLQPIIATALTGVAIGLAVCAGGGGNSKASVPSSPTNMTEPFVDCTYDYQPMKGPKQMASLSDLVVEGTLGRARAGLLHFRKNGGRPRRETDIFPVEATRVLKPGGKEIRDVTPQFEGHGAFQVETGCAFGPPNRNAKLASLAGRKVLVYLTHHLKGQSFPRTGYGQAGRPKRLFQASSLEGFLVELASGKGVRDLELNQQYPDADLSQFLPNELRFPPRK